jgi:hypothetical protein
MPARRGLIAVALLGVAAACADTAPSAPSKAARTASFDVLAGGVETNISTPITGLTVFVPCAVGGAGETISLDGNLHVLINTTVDAQGGIHLKTHFQPQGLSGTGLTSGDKYQGTGVTQDQTIVTAAGVRSFVNNFRMIGQGPGNNFMVHENLSITVDAGGDVTASHDNLTTSCN